MLSPAKAGMTDELPLLCGMNLLGSYTSTVFNFKKEPELGYRYTLSRLGRTQSPPPHLSAHTEVTTTGRMEKDVSQRHGW